MSKKIHIIILCHLFLLALPPKALAQNVDEPNAKYEQALQLREDGNNGQAKKLLYEQIVENPTHMEGFRLLALLEAYDNNWQAAEKYIATALELSPSDPESRITKARILAWQTQFNDALSIMSEVTQEFPTYSDAWAFKGRLALYLGKYSLAQTLFDKAFDLDPENLDALLGKGDVLQSIDKEDEALNIFNQANDLYPYNDEILLRIKRIKNSDVPIKDDTAFIVYSYSSINNEGYAPWKQYTFGINHYLSQNTSIMAKVDHAQRFSLNDVSGELEVTHKISKKIRGSINFGHTPNANFLAQMSYGGALDFTLSKGHIKSLFGPTNLAIYFKHRKYGPIKVDGLDMEISQYLWSDAVLLSGKMFNSFTAEGKRISGGLAKVDYYPNDQFSLNIGYARAPESDQGIVTVTKSYFGGASIKLNNKLFLRLNYAHHDRLGSYTRKEFVASIALNY